MKHILVVVSSSPFAGMQMRESLDMTLIFAAIDQKVSWLFKDEALFALKKNQSPASAQLKDFFKTFGTLALYDVDALYYDLDAANRLALSALHDDFKSVTQEVIHELINDADFVVTL